MASLTGSFTVPHELAAQVSTPGGVDDVKHLIGGTRLRLNGLVAAAGELEAAR